MQKFIRFILWFVGALVLLGVVLSVALQVLVDPNDYREDIAAAVADATGRELIIEGDLSLKTFPCCGVRLGPLELSNPPDFPDEHFARVENAAVSVRVLPLILSQELAVGEVVLDGLDLILINREDGSVNWEFDDTVDEEQPVEAEATEDSSPAIGGLSVAGIAVTDGRILYIDEALGEEIEVADINLSTSEIEGDSLFELEASLDVSGLAPDTALALDLKTGAVLDVEAGTIDLAALTMRVDATGGELPGGEAQLNVQLAEATGLGADEFALAGLEVSVSAAGLDIVLRGDGKVIGETPVLAGDLAIADFSPRDLLKQLGEPPMNTADPAVLAKAGLQSDWKLDGDTAELSDFRFTLDDSTATGWLNVASIEDERLEFDLQFDAIDVDRYSEPVVEGHGASGSGTDESSDALDLPVDDMRALNLEGHLGFGRLRVAEALLTNVSINISAKDGLIRLNPLTADIYGGNYSGDIRVDVRSNTPKMSVNENLSGFQLDEFLQDTQGDASVSGVANMRVTATSSGDTISALTKTLNGDASVDLQDGKYLGVDLWHEIRTARAKIKKEEVPPAPADPYTDISQFSATAKFADGIARNRDLQARAPLISLTGSGDIDLVKSVMDYRLEAKVTGEKEFEDGYNIDDFEGIRIPVKLRGPLDDPSVTVELGKVLGDLAAKKAKDRLMKKLGIDEGNEDGDEESSDPKEKLKQGLRGLFGK